MTQKARIIVRSFLVSLVFINGINTQWNGIPNSFPLTIQNTSLNQNQQRPNHRRRKFFILGFNPNLKVRPIYHWKPQRVKAHLAISFTAYMLAPSAFTKNSRRTDGWD